MMKMLLLLLSMVAATAFAQSAPDFSQGFTNLGNSVQPAVATLPAAAKPDTSAYTLGGGDKVRMTVFGEEDLTGEYDVDGTGTLALPLIGNVNVKGKTLRQAEGLITAQYAHGYLVNPRVSLEVLNFRPFFILGEVSRPGSYPYVNDMTVINAVALAGGYTPRASTGTVYLRRAADPKHGEVEVDEAAKVGPGDVIRVDERFF
jgi:polysaccharide export outer membrane protein